MAVPAIDPIVGNMMFVTKRDRLSPRHSYFRDIGGAVESCYDQRQGNEKSEPAKDTDPGDCVRASVENLRHQPEPVGCENL